MRVSKVPLLIMLFALAVASSAVAQVNATLTGVVKDTSGAVLPGVTVEASSPALIDKVRSTVTDTNGQYRITTLPPGTYTVRFTLTGFSAVSQEGIVLETGFTATISPDMRVGSVTETIVVTGETPVVDVESSRQLRVVDGEALKELPSGRSPSQLLSMIPGMNGGSGICTGGHLRTDAERLQRPWRQYHRRPPAGRWHGRWRGHRRRRRLRVSGRRRQRAGDYGQPLRRPRRG